MTRSAPRSLAARAVGELARRAGRGGGTSLPGKVLIRSSRGDRQLAARLPRGSAVISATNGKTTTAAMVASVLDRAGVTVVHNRAGANMAGGVASTLLAAARPGGRIDGELGLFEVDEFWLDRITPAAQPARRCCSATCSAISSTATASSRRSPTAGRRWSEDSSRRALVLNADDPLIADLGRERAGRHLLRRRGPLGGAAARCSTPRTPSTAAAAAPHTCTTRSTSAISDATAAPPAASSAPRRRSPPSGSRSTAHGGARSSWHPAGASAASSCRCPGSTTSTTRSAPPRCAWRSGSRSTRSPPGLAAVSGRLRPGRANLDRRRRAPDPADQEPSRRERDPAHARARARRARRCSRSSTTAPPTAATSRGSGTPTSSCSPAACASVTCAGTRAAELAVRLKYAGVPTDRLTRDPRPAHALDAALAARRRAAVRVADVHRAAGASRGALARGHVAAVLGAGAVSMSVIWHDLECGAYDDDLPLWRALAAEHGEPVLDVGAGTGRVDARPRTRRLSGHRARPRSGAARRAQRRASWRTRAGRRRCWPTRATSRSGARFPLCIVPMQTIQLLGGARRPWRFLGCARRHLRAGGRAGDRDRRELEPFELARRRARRRSPTCASSTASSTPASRPRSGRAATASCSSAGARRSPAVATHRRARRDPPRSADVDELEREAAPSGCSAAGRGHRRRPPTTRQRGGDARVPERCCACARSIRI